MDTLKNGFGPQFNGFMQPFDGSLYTGYSYNNWDTKIPSPLGGMGSKTSAFPWGLPNAVNPLPSVVSSQPMCFSAPGQTMSSGMVPNMNMHGTVPGAQAPGMSSAAPGAACPYAPSASPYGLPRDSQCSSSIASLRWKAKQYSTNLAYPTVSTRQPTLSACQYASVGNGTSS